MLVRGDRDDNNLVGTDESDVLRGRFGNDTLEGLGGADELNGGAGQDTASYAISDQGVRIDLGTGRARGGDAEGDTFISIENLQGSSNGDTLTGDNKNNTLLGGDGYDILEGGAGADYLDGGDFIGTADIASYRGSDAGVTVNLATGEASGGHAEGDTLVNIDYLTGSVHNDVLTGHDEATRVNRDAFTQIVGGGGDDTITAGTAGGFLFGNQGNDTLNGGDSADVFNYIRGDDHDTITNFSTEQRDRIQLFQHDDLDNFADIQTLLAQDGENTVITFDDDNSITLLGVDVGDLSASSFTIA